MTEFAKLLLEYGLEWKHSNPRNPKEPWQIYPGFANIIGNLGLKNKKHSRKIAIEAVNVFFLNGEGILQVADEEKFLKAFGIEKGAYKLPKGSMLGKKLLFSGVENYGDEKLLFRYWLIPNQFLLTEEQLEKLDKTNREFKIKRIFNSKEADELRRKFILQQFDKISERVEASDNAKQIRNRLLAAVKRDILTKHKRKVET